MRFWPRSCASCDNNVRLTMFAADKRGCGSGFAALVILRLQAETGPLG